MKVLNGDLDCERIPAGDDSFDAVILNEVFEHLRINLIFSMREILRVLRPGGKLLLSTPNLRFIRGIYNLIVRQEAAAVMGGLYHNYSSLEASGVMGHVREYTAKEVLDFLREIGFRPRGVVYRGCYKREVLLAMVPLLHQNPAGIQAFFLSGGRESLALPTVKNLEPRSIGESSCELYT